MIPTGSLSAYLMRISYPHWPSWNRDQDAAHLAKLAGMSVSYLHEKLSYMVEHNFLYLENGTYRADTEKLTKVMEKDGSFSHVIDGVTEMDSYLN